MTNKSNRCLPLALVLILTAAMAGCSGESEKVEGSHVPVGDGWSEAGATAADAAGQADALTSDAGGSSATDAGVPDSQLTPSDTAVADTQAVDAGKPDAGPQDAGTPDAGQPDAGKPDAGTPGVCESKLKAFNGLKSKALACTSNFQCYAPSDMVEGQGFVFGAPENIGCDCQRYYSDASTDAAALADLNAEFTKAKCKAACPKKLCAPLDTQIGVCTAGSCQTKSATCKEMETLVGAAVTAGRKCTKDSQCSNFGMQGNIPCGCPVNVNLSTLAPGKPLFLYITMITRAYSKLGCAKGVTCACATIGKGACVSGVCTTKK
ncbi:MAG: hypothetical protein KC502_19270 [Myxococcales bacterium]|nr:hypothetical protein [Myxococcales bacterium]